MYKIIRGGRYRLFIAFTGLHQAGIITASKDTLLTLGDLSNPGALLALAGIFVMAVLVIKQVKGGILIGILGITVIGIL